MSEVEHDPGDLAPASGVFHEINIFGTSTGLTAQVEAGEPLPGAPVGWLAAGRSRGRHGVRGS
jgi:hypothetical protein